MERSYTKIGSVLLVVVWFTDVLCSKINLEISLALHPLRLLSEMCPKDGTDGPEINIEDFRHNFSNTNLISLIISKAAVCVQRGIKKLLKISVCNTIHGMPFCWIFSSLRDANGTWPILW